nr:transposase [Chloroflexota bacterium]
MTNDDHAPALFQGKYRVPSARLKGWDYTSSGLYFVTICTKERIPFLGDIVNGEMHLSSIGEIVAEEWRKTEQIRPNVILDAWVIMPNHMHAIIGITAVTVETPQRDLVSVETPQRDLVSVETPQRDLVSVETPQRDLVSVETPQRDLVSVETPQRGVSTATTTTTTSVPRLPPNSLGSIIGQFKSVCTKRIWAMGWHDFAWQARFYDHIIRHEVSLQRIRQYIVENPSQWEQDQNNPTNLYM